MSERQSSRAGRVLRVDEVFRHPWLKIEWTTIIDQAGVAHEEVIAMRDDFVIVVPHFPATAEVLVAQRYRYAPDAWCWELPQGRMVGGSDWRPACAQVLHDVSESLDAPELEYRGWWYEASAMSGHRCHCVLARFPGRPPRSGLPPYMRLLSLTDAADLAELREGHDAATIAAYARCAADLDPGGG